MNAFSMEQPGHILSVDEILSLVNLTMASDQGYDWFYVWAHANNKIVEDVQDKVDGWKSRYWWFSGDWQSPVDELGSFDKIEFPTKFGYHHGKV